MAQDEPQQTVPEEGAPEIPEAPVPSRRRLFLLLLPPLTSLLLLIGIFVYENHNPPAWQVALDDYLAEKTGPQGAAPAVALVLTASHPENFTRDMPFNLYSQSTYYRADSPASAEVGEDSRRPLPFPPPEVWCFLLADGSKSEASAAGFEANRVILVARHQDLFNADWLVYEAAGSNNWDVAAALDQIGCDFQEAQRR